MSNDSWNIPSPGSILLNSFAMRIAANFLKNEVFDTYVKRNRAFFSLMQLVESLVIHEKIFIPVFFAFLTTYPETNEKPFSGRYNFKELAQKRFLGDDVDLNSTGLAPATFFFDFIYKSVLIRELGTTKFGPSGNVFTPPKEFLNYPPVVISDDPETYKLSPYAAEGGLPTYIDSEDQVIFAAETGLAYKPAFWDGEYVKKLIKAAKKRSYFGSFVSETFGQIEKNAVEEIERKNRFLQEERYKLEIPIVFAYVLDQYKPTQESIIETALRVRESKEASAFRKVCALFDEAARVGNDSELSRISKEIQLATDKMKYSYQSPVHNISLQFPWAIGFNPIEEWEELKNKRKRHLIFLENLYRSASKSKGTLLALYKIKTQHR